MRSIAFVILFMNVWGLKLTAQTLPLPNASREVPFYTDSLRDPAIAEQRILDDLTAETTYERWMSLRDSLKTQTSKVGTLTEMLDLSVRLVYFMEDRAMGRVSSSTQVIDLKTLRTQTARFARMLAQEKKISATLRAKALFHANVNEYLLGQNPAIKVKEMKDLKGLNAHLNRRRNFLVAWHGLRAGNQAESEVAVRSIKGMIPSFPLHAAISMRLIAGRYHAGVSTSGKKYRTADKAYRALFQAAAERASSLNDAEQSAVLHFIVAVWQQAEGKAIDWNNPPFRLKAYPRSDVTMAIVERSAMQDARRGQHKSSIDKYRILSSSFAGSTRTRIFDDRMVSVAESAYKKTKDSRQLEEVLTSLVTKYSSDDVLGEGVASNQTRQQYDLKLTKLVDAEIRAAKGKNSPVVQRNQAIAMANRAIQKSEDAQVKEKYAFEIGFIHQAHQNHTKAVEQFMDLALNGREEIRAKSYTFAISSQSHLAKWPKEAPWSGIPKGPGAQRVELARMYEGLNQAVGGKTGWEILSHQGLLYLAVGEKDKALALWDAGLQNLPPHRASAFAAGFMLVDYESASSWDSLERIARLALTKSITPIYNKRSLSVHQYLATALLEGGKEKLAAGESKIAVEKLSEFVKKYKNDPRHHEGFYHYALALYKDKKFIAGINTMQQFVETYPRSSFHKPALLIGAEWSVASALEEKSLYFMQEFLSHYDRDEKAQGIREELVEIYKGKLLYRQVAQIYKRMSDDQRVDLETRLMTDRERLYIELQHNSPEAASVLARELMAKYKTNNDLKILGLGIQAITAAQAGKLEEVSKLEQAMTSLGHTSKEGIEMLGWVRYVKAGMMASKVQEEVQAVALHNPLKHMNDRYQSYLALKSGYDAVCEGVSNSYCAGAMFELARFSQEAIKAFEDYSIAETLDQKSVATFNNRKSDIIRSLSQTAMASNAKALELAAVGENQPSLVKQIIWSNSADWTYENESGEGGHGFVQWKTID